MRSACIYVVLALIAVSCSNVRSACNWDSTLTCLQAVGGGARSPKANLSNIVDSFEAGVQIRCNMLQTLVNCMKDATKDCRPDEDNNNRYKIVYNNMVPVVDYFCVKNINKFTTNGQCMTKPALKAGMIECQKIIDGQDANCNMFKATIACTDTLLYKECDVIHHEVGHVLRMYIKNVMNLDNCQVPEHDNDAHHHEHDHEGHVHDGAVTIQLHSLTALLIILASHVTVCAASGAMH